MSDLRCPHCGGGLYINTEWAGRPYMQEQMPESIECETCESVWEPDGTARDEPKWIRYPDLYEAPR